MATKGYHSYSGRRNNTKKIVLVVILVLILLAAVAFLLMQRYIVYDDDGGIRLELPLHKQHSDKPDPLPQVDEDTIQREEPSDVPDPEPEMKPAPAVEELHAVELPHDCLSGDPSGLLEGQSAVVVNLKRYDGSLTYQSSIALPETVLQGDSDTLANLSRITESDCYTVARISSLCDNAFSLGQPESAMRYSDGSLWYDNYSRNWLDPSQTGAREYLCNLAAECQKLGFDELLLDHFRYPIEGDLGVTTLDPGTDRGAVLAQLADKIRETAPSMHLSIILPASIGTDYSFAASGLPAEVLMEHFDRIYVPRESSAYYWLDSVLDSDYDRQTKLVITDYAPVAGSSYLVIQ